MVKEALHERANLLEIAPHLSFPLPIMLPVYRWWQVRSKLFTAFCRSVPNHFVTFSTSQLVSFPLPIMLPVYRWWQVRSKLFS